MQTKMELAVDLLVLDLRQGGGEFVDHFLQLIVMLIRVGIDSGSG